MKAPDEFPWPPQGFGEIFYSGDFQKNDGTVVKSAELKNKVKGIYFSAHWVSILIKFSLSLIWVKGA